MAFPSVVLGLNRCPSFVSLTSDKIPGGCWGLVLVACVIKCLSMKIFAVKSIVTMAQDLPEPTLPPASQGSPTPQGSAEEVGL